MNLYEKWLKILSAYFNNQKAKCPVCGKENLDHGYIVLNEKEHIGYGAVWCKNCRHAFNISRAVIKTNDKILSELPTNLVYG